MTPKNRTSGGMGVQKSSKVVGHHLWMIPYVTLFIHAFMKLKQLTREHLGNSKASSCAVFGSRKIA